MRTKRLFVDGEYGQIHLRLATPESGTFKSHNRPLFCLHMSPKSGRIFARFMEAFATDRQVVAPDYPGYGESDSPPATPAVTIADYARSVWQVADALSCSAIDLLGYHTGSLVAAEMARQRPDQIGRIVMIGAPVFLPAELEAVKTHFEPVPLDEAGTRFINMWQSVLKHASKGGTLEQKAESFAENLRGGENYEWGHRAAFAYAPQFPAMVKSLPQRIDVINPDDDLYQATLRITDVLQRGEVHARPQWGHGFLDFDTEAAVSDIRQLLEITPPPTVGMCPSGF
ncbi:alpha/beta hydrolase [Halioxenophilus sp. WMMB6]|uniref:alpha/beta hydrolase n=1 Tax=Halioxenophilus sp. WMMB6 TaxID=3073815 RepID=UPI00295EE150|nr:alpha/beta hydrolase [Halioxenophilus sp. WMMB6]